MPFTSTKRGTVKPPPHQLTKWKLSNPLLLFMAEINDRATHTPRPIIDHINRIFLDLPPQAKNARGFDYDLAYLYYLKISCRVNLLCSQHALMRLTPADKGYLPAAKVTAQWMAMDAKFNKARVKELKQRKQKKQKGSSPTGFTFPERQDGGIVMGE